MSDRLREVLLCLVKAMSNKEVGRALSISDQTARNHVSRLMKHYGVHDRVAVVMCALARGDVDLNQSLAHWR